MNVEQQFQRLFPKLCNPRKRHVCRLCGKFIQIAEPCCRWVTFEDGPATHHTHPECYKLTLKQKWDDGDWECISPGDIERPIIEHPTVEVTK